MWNKEGPPHCTRRGGPSSSVGSIFRASRFREPQGPGETWRLNEGSGVRRARRKERKEECRILNLKSECFRIFTKSIRACGIPCCLRKTFRCPTTSSAHARIHESRTHVSGTSRFTTGGELQCVTSLSKINVSVELLSRGMTRAAIRTVRRFLRGFLDVPVLFCGLPLSFGESCLRMRRGADTERMLCAIASTMEEIAGQQNVRLLCFKEFDHRGAGEVDHIRKMGYIQAHSLPSCCLPVRWKTFDDYVASTRAGYRRQIAATLRRRRECGLQIRRVGEFGRDVEAIYALYLEVMDRAPFQLERLNRSFFDKLDVNLGARSHALLLERNGKLLAAAIMLTTPSVTNFLLTGIDYSINREYQVYPNLILAVVAEAIRVGAPCLEMGRTSYAMKSRIGAEPTPRYIYLRHRGWAAHSFLKRASRFLFPKTVYPTRRVFRE